ncbi:TonB-dependent siderophore receptor [Sphingobium sufflavum]|uniref:TonB-dependent receptor n=1 Tax=Sphingobium sufflavum TaxID=1129547 RepID=UPI001F455282|nr:TonB-dependent siderophore receptor [Sphingobium sufflavum]MCE7798634.1 TonB-dependent siderophore receptor [Sphingobium sufflavum]
MSKATTPSFLALSCVGAITFATAAHAQEAEQGRKLGAMTVTDSGVAEPRVKVDKPASPKYTAPLVDTPQTITVISRASLDQQNLLTLREVLSTVPGISFTAGEGGNGFADNINIMGVDARNDINVNGVRSSSNLNRNETFNIEQVEVTTGANSVYNGGGNVAGSINLVTKRPLADNKIVAQAGIGTDNYYRATIDVNRRLNDIIAVRINGVYHQNDVPGRDTEYFDRWGVAPSIMFGVDGPTSLTLQYEHLTDHALPQYGVRYFPQLGGIPRGVSSAGYYGIANVDKQNSKTNAVQAIAEHAFSDKIRLRNQFRYENIVQETVTTQPTGNYCVDLFGTGVGNTIANGGGLCPEIQNGAGTTLTAGVRVPLGYYQPTGATRGAARNMQNETLSEQIDLSGSFNTGSIEHSFTVGASYLWERFQQTNYGNLTTRPAGGWALINVANPDQLIPGPAIAGVTYGTNSYNGPLTYTLGTRTFGTQEVFAGYLFDTVKFNDWLQVNGGIRYERVKGDNYDITNPPTVNASGDGRSNFRGIRNSLFSYRVGLVFKPLSNVSLYVAHGSAKRPSQSSVSSACTQSETGTANTCSLRPETTRNYEIGAKTELFDKQLLLTASVFRNSQDSIRVNSANPTVGGTQQLDGRRRTQGFTLGATGNITEGWTINGSYMYVDPKIIQSVADGLADTQSGGIVTNTPKHSGSVFTSYSFPFGLQVGYGVTYQGKLLLTTINNTNPSQLLNYVPAYTTQRLMVAYKIDDNFKAQVNVQNLFNERYVTTVRNDGWATPGTTRQAVFSLTGTF